MHEADFLIFFTRHGRGGLRAQLLRQLFGFLIRVR